VSDEPRKEQSGLSLKTLVIAAAASATAALVVPLIWEPGTVFAAAMTPIIVTVVSELLKKPAETVSVVRSRRTGDAARRRRDEPFDPLAPAPPEELDALPPAATQRAVHSPRRLTPRQWKVALLTGVAGFACAVAVVTASELIAGEGSQRNPTTFLGGSGRDDDKEPAGKRREQDPTTPTPVPSETPAGTTTPTPAPTTTATPTPTPTPAPAAPAPGSQLDPPASPEPAP
jgi:hypothetical protein